MTIFDQVYMAAGTLAVEARAALRMSKDQVHRACGVHPATIRKIEFIDRHPEVPPPNLTWDSVSTLLQFYAHYGITMDPLTFEVRKDLKKVEEGRTKFQLELATRMSSYLHQPVPDQ